MWKRVHKLKNMDGNITGQTALVSSYHLSQLQHYLLSYVS